MKTTAKDYLLLHFAILIYALGSVPSKLASGESFLSFKYIFYMSLLFASLVIYAFLWQQTLKRIPLTIAYVNKGITIVWSMLIGLIVFKEGISVKNLIGAFVVIMGMIMLIYGENRNE